MVGKQEKGTGLQTLLIDEEPLPTGSPLSVQVDSVMRILMTKKVMTEKDHDPNRRSSRSPPSESVMIEKSIARNPKGGNRDNPDRNPQREPNDQNHQIAGVILRSTIRI